MIAFFRKQKKNIAGGFIVLCISLMMIIPSGLEYFGGSSMKRYIAKVGDTEIPYNDYYNEIRRTEAMYRSQFGEQYEMFAKMLNIKDRVLDDMIDRTLLSHLYASNGLTTSFSQVEQYALTLPMFEKGVDRQTFESFLRSTGLKEYEFEQKVREQVLEDMLGSVFELAAVTSPVETEKRLKQANAKITVSYAKVVLPAEEAKVIVSEDEVGNYYNDNKGAFFSERMIEPVVVRFPLSAYKDKVVVHEEDVQDLFKRNYSDSDRSIEEVRQDLEKELRESIAPEYAKAAAEEFISKLIQASETDRASSIESLTKENALIEVVSASEPLSLSSQSNLISPTVQSDVFQMKKSGVRLFMDKTTPIVVFIKNATEPQQKNLEQVRDDISLALKKEKINNRTKEYASQILKDKIMNHIPSERYTAFKSVVNDYKFDLQTTEEASYSKVSIPLVSNPQDTPKITASLIEDKTLKEPFISSDAQVYLMALSSYVESDNVQPSELSEFIKSEKQFSRARAFMTVLNKLKSSTTVDVVHEYLEQ